MKKLLIIAILAGGGFWYYKNFYSLPIYGEWAPNEKEFMRQAYEKSAMTTMQEKQLKSYIASVRVIINRGGDAEFRFPGKSGSFPYKISQTSTGCYSLDVSELGSFESCIEGGSMKMRNTKTGYVETYDKI